MKYIKFFILALAIVFTTGLYASGTSSAVKSNKTIFVNANKTVNLESSILYNTNISTESKGNIEVCEEATTCRMTISGTTGSGINYRISGRCGAVLRKLKKLEKH